MPPKSNVKRLRGLEARTGSSNFDVAEAVWLKLARELAAEAPTIAILCKTSVARGILQFAHRAGLPIARCLDPSDRCGAMVRRGGRRLPVPRHSGRRRIGRGACRCPRSGVPVYPGLDSGEPAGMLGFARGWLIADREAYASVARSPTATCPRTWRQGLKHDAAAVMELTVEPGTGRLRNGDGRAGRSRAGIRLSADQGGRPPPAAGRAARPRRCSSPRSGSATIPARLASAAPRLWAYLDAHAERFERRRSSIYRGRPPFAIFGVGPYSFAPFKVAISGLHKAPAFRAVGPARRPPGHARRHLLLPPLLVGARRPPRWRPCATTRSRWSSSRSASFPDAKRPITKALLQRLDLRAILERADRKSLLDRAAAVLADELAIDPAPAVTGAGGRRSSRISGKAGAEATGVRRPGSACPPGLNGRP